MNLAQVAYTAVRKNTRQSAGSRRYVGVPILFDDHCSIRDTVPLLSRIQYESECFSYLEDVDSDIEVEVAECISLMNDTDEYAKWEYDARDP